MSEHLLCRKQDFKIPNPKFSAEFSGHWKEVNNDTTFTYDEYNLTVEEDATEILFNFVKKNYNDILRRVYITPDGRDARTEVWK